MRLTEVNSHSSTLGDLGMTHHFPALVVGQRFTRSPRHAVQRGNETLDSRGGGCVVHLHQHQITRAEFYQSSHRRSIGFALDQVTFPVTRRQAILHLRWSHMNTDQVGDLVTTVNLARAGAATGFALAQADDQRLAKLTDGQRVNGVVDCLATDVHVFKIWEFHISKLAGNLLRRKALSRQMYHQVEQLTVRQQLALRTAGGATLAHVLLSLARPVIVGLGAVATKLAADGRGTSIKHSGDGSLAQTLKLAKLDRDAFFDTEFLVGHGNTVPDWSGVALSFCRRQDFSFSYAGC